MQLLISSCIRNFRLQPASALLVSVNALQIFGPATAPIFPSVCMLAVWISQVWFRVFVFVFVFILAPPPTTPYAHVGHVPVPRRRAQPAITAHVVACYAASCASATANSYSGGFLPAGIDARSRPSRGRTTHAPSRDPPSHARGTRGFPRGTQRAALRPLQTQAEVLCDFGRRRCVQGH